MKNIILFLEKHGLRAPFSFYNNLYNSCYLIKCGVFRTETIIRNKDSIKSNFPTRCNQLHLDNVKRFQAAVKF